MNRIGVTFPVSAITLASLSASAVATEHGCTQDVSLSGGVQGLMYYGSLVRDNFVMTSPEFSVVHRATQVFAPEGAFPWLIPVKGHVSLVNDNEPEVR